MLPDADGSMNAILSFCDQLRDDQGPLMAQGMSDDTDPLHLEAGEDAVSPYVVHLPFSVKPDFEEGVIKV